MSLSAASPSTNPDDLGGPRSNVRIISSRQLDKYILAHGRVGGIEAKPVVAGPNRWGGGGRVRLLAEKGVIIVGRDEEVLSALREAQHDAEKGEHGSFKGIAIIPSPEGSESEVWEDGRQVELVTLSEAIDKLARGSL